jgi:hypothetical protein
MDQWLSKIIYSSKINKINCKHKFLLYIKVYFLLLELWWLTDINLNTKNILYFCYGAPWNASFV